MSKRKSFLLSAEMRSHAKSRCALWCWPIHLEQANVGVSSLVVVGVNEKLNHADKWALFVFVSQVNHLPSSRCVQLHRRHRF